MIVHNYEWNRSVSNFYAILLYSESISSKKVDQSQAIQKELSWEKELGGMSLKQQGDQTERKLR